MRKEDKRMLKFLSIIIDEIHFSELYIAKGRFEIGKEKEYNWVAKIRKLAKDEGFTGVLKGKKFTTITVTEKGLKKLKELKLCKL